MVGFAPLSLTRTACRANGMGAPADSVVELVILDLPGQESRAYARARLRVQDWSWARAILLRNSV